MGEAECGKAFEELRVGELRVGRLEGCWEVEIGNLVYLRARSAGKRALKGDNGAWGAIADYFGGRG